MNPKFSAFKTQTLWLALLAVFALGTGLAHDAIDREGYFEVRSATTEDTIWWENNAAMSPEGFDALYDDMIAHMQGKDYYVQDLKGGADPAHSIKVRMITELAWHGLFIRHLLRRPDTEDLQNFIADFTVINCPSFQADPARHDCRSNDDQDDWPGAPLW